MRNLKVFFVSLLAMLFFLGGQPPSAVRSQEKDHVQTITVTGKLQRVAAMGGETTGWAVALDKPLQLEGKALTRLEIDPAGKKVAGWENRHLETRGTLEKRRGVERVYWVLVVQEIRLLANKK